MCKDGGTLRCLGTFGSESAYNLYTWYTGGQVDGSRLKWTTFHALMTSQSQLNMHTVEPGGIHPTRVRAIFKCDYVEKYGSTDND